MSDEQLKQYYAARATEYDRIYAKPERQQDLRAIESWLPSEFEGRSVIELACGTGYWTPFLARTARDLVALDASPETLQIAQSRAGVDTVRFIHGDAYELQQLAPEFDGAFAGFWISHVPRGRIGAFIDGLHSQLRPRSKVVFLDNRFVPGNSTPICEQAAEGNTYHERRLGDGSTYRVIKNFPLESELISWVHAVAATVRYREMGALLGVQIRA